MNPLSHEASLAFLYTVPFVPPQNPSEAGGLASSVQIRKLGSLHINLPEATYIQTASSGPNMSDSKVQLLSFPSTLSVPGPGKVVRHQYPGLGGGWRRPQPA